MQIKFWSNKKHFSIPISFIIVFIFSTMIGVWYFKKETPYNFKLIEKRVSPEIIPLFYIDFQDDGLSEFIRVWYNEDSSYTGIVIYRNDGVLLEQINLKGRLYFKPDVGLQWLHIADYDSNELKDIFAFHLWNDTLFLALIEFKDKPELKWDIPLLTKPKNVENWDVYINDIQYKKLNRDKPPYLIFSLLTGIGLKPRGIFAVDIHHRLIAFKFESAIAIGKFFVADISHKNPGYEILLVTNTNSNYPPDAPPPNDHKSWFLILNSHLEPLFPPKELLSAYSFVYPIWCSKQSKILTVIGYNGRKERSSRIIVWTPLGNPLKKLPLYHMTNINVHYIEQIPDLIYLFNVKKSKLHIYNCDLKLIKTKNIRLLQLKYWNKNDLILLTPQNIQLVDSLLNIKAMFLLDPPLSRLIFISEIHNKNNKSNEIALSDGKVFWRLRLVHNPQYKYRWAILPLVSIVTFLGLYLIYFIIIFIFLVIAYFYTSLKNNPNLTFIISPNGHILYGKNKIIKFLDIPDEYSIRKIDNLKEITPILTNKIKETFKTKKRFSGEIFIIREDEYKSILLQIEPLKIFYFVVAFYVELKENTTHELNQRLEIWGETLQRMIHDIKTPLSSVYHGLQAMEYRIKQLELNNKEKQSFVENLEVLTQSIEKIYRKAQQFLKITKVIEPNFKIYDIHSILRNSLSSYKKYFNHQGIITRLNFDNDVPLFCMDGEQLEVAFNILIENAIDAMEGKGVLTINTLFQMEVSSQEPYVEIQIADTGQGIPEIIRPYIFKKRIQSKKQKGSGIGLLLVKNIIQTHGGVIDFQTNKNGTIFFIRIPINKKC